MAKQTEQTDKVTSTKTQSNWYNLSSGGRGLAYGAGAFIILLIVFAAGAAAARHHRENVLFTGGPGPHMMGMPERQGFMGGGFDDTTATNGQTRIAGVVTAVNGSSFTLAGHGSTTNVTTNSSTQYQGGNAVKQNDSVAVFGTTSNGTLTATQIIINP